MADNPAPMTFQVVINDVQFSEAHIKNFSEKIKSLMLAELAQIDNRGDFKAKPLPTARGFGGIGGGTAGMVVDRG